MTITRVIISVAGALTLVSCGQPADVPSTPPSPAAIEPVRLIECPADDPGRACEYDHATAPKEFEAALKGDYQAQRNTGFVLAHGNVGVQRRPVQGCAWRMVLLVSGSPKVNDLDTTNYELDCGALSSRDQDRAREVASLIYRRVYGADLPTLPAFAAS